MGQGIGARRCRMMATVGAAVVAALAGWAAAPARASYLEIRYVDANERTGIATDPQNRLWIAEQQDNRVRVYRTDGSVVRAYPVQDAPADVAALPDGSFVVSSVGAGAQIARYSAAGSTLWSAGVPDWSWKHSLVLTSDGKLFSQHHLRIYRIDLATGAELADGFDVGEDDRLIGPGANGTLLVSTPSGVRETTVDGTVVRTLDPVAGALGAVGSDGTYYTWDQYEPFGLYRHKADGTAAGAVMDTPTDLAVAADGALWSLEGQMLQRIEPDVPVPAIRAPAAVSTGDDVTLKPDAGVPFGAIATVHWDVDGNGTYETAGGAGWEAHTTFATPGVKTVGMQVTSSAGVTRTGMATVDVRLRSPDGAPGIAINDGAPYTNDPHVTVELRWPALTQSALLANDGGFGAARGFPIAATIPWTLDASGPEQTAKTVHVRFTGSTDGPAEYQDDIVLDRTPPVVVSAVAAARKLSLVAHDATAGIGEYQVKDRAGHAGAWRPFAARSRFSAVPVQVRVRDRAGNGSRWRRTRVTVARTLVLRPGRTTTATIALPDTGKGAHYSLAVKKPGGVTVVAKRLDRKHRRYTVRLRNGRGKAQRVMLTAVAG